MNILLACFAFAAIMIVLSTMASTIVEAIHKLSRQRAKDFERMLKNYYIGSVQPLINESGGEAVDSFVSSIRKNPAFDKDGANGKKTKNPFKRILNRVFDTSFETLTTPQYVEQLARSPIAKTVSERLEKTEEQVIERLASEFERYGDAATDYFSRRAQVLSVVVAIAVAITLNVDALRLFKALANDSNLASEVVEKFDPEDWQEKATSAVGNQEAKALIQGLELEVKAQAKYLSEWRLPIGNSFFPYCFSGEETARNRIDEKCNIYNSIKSEAGGVARWYEIGLALAFSSYFWSWVLNALLSGLLIGLGAPFWFNIYTTLSAYIPNNRKGARTETRSTVDSQPLVNRKNLNVPIATHFTTIHQQELTKLFISAK